MQKAQSIFYNLFQIDIVNKITSSALALSIYRTHYYDDEKWPIYIPSQNADNFIRKGYYGGHSDAYIPRGENLYYYDVNSLYPYIMQQRPMPGGKARWIEVVEKKHLDTMVGFVFANVECPLDIKRPFLPYRNPKDNILIFPTGSFSGVYYTEELKYAKTLGYNVIMHFGYFYERMDSPFKETITALYENRLEAKQAGNNAVSFVYKILMNSLYGIW